MQAKNRQQHAGALREQLAHVAIAQQQRVAEQQEANVQSAIGIQVEFESEQGVAMAAESLARDHRGIELLNVRKQGTQIFATVFVPQGKLDHFEKLITDYVDHKTDKNGKALDHQSLVDAISALRVATFESLWTDTADAFSRADGRPGAWQQKPAPEFVARDEHDCGTTTREDHSRVFRRLTTR